MFLNEIPNLSTNELIISDTVKNLHRILDIRDLTEDTFVLKLERKNINFRAGQHIQIKVPGNKSFRVYSVYSGEHDDFLEVLVKEIKEGYFTPILKKVHIGEYLELKGPSGHYHLRFADIETKKFLFIASGTGISPFHCFVKSYNNLDYKLLHGVRYANEAYEKEVFDSKRITICTTGDKKGHFQGRVTSYLEQNMLDKSMLVYLCGNSNMIMDSIEILKKKGFKNEQIFVESYF